MEHTLTVRFFAAAAEAAGSEEITLAPVTTREELQMRLAKQFGCELEHVLKVCAWVADGQVISSQVDISGVSVIEVLPPFAGG